MKDTTKTKTVIRIIAASMLFALSIGLIVYNGLSTKYIENTSALENSVTTTTIVPTTSTSTTSTTTSTTSTTTTKPTTTSTTSTITTTTTVETTTEPIETTTTISYIQEEKFNQRKSEDNWLFVGDSRMVFWYTWGLYGEYIAESGQGLNMIYDNYDEITSYRDYNIVFNLGANQWWSGGEYVDLLNSFPEEFIQNNHLIVMPVNPTDGRFYWMNDKFDNYNSIVKEYLRDEYEYIDTANYMKNNGYSTADGLHYTTNQDYIIYNFLMNGE